MKQTVMQMQSDTTTFSELTMGTWFMAIGDLYLKTSESGAFGFKDSSTWYHMVAEDQSCQRVKVEIFWTPK